MDSVQRYTKTFALTRFKAKVPELTWQRATEAAQDWRHSVSEALLNSKGAKTPIAVAALAAIRAAKARDGSWESKKATSRPQPVETDDEGWASD